MSARLKQRQGSRSSPRPNEYDRDGLEYNTGNATNERAWIADWFLPNDSHGDVCNRLEGRPTGTFFIRPREEDRSQHILSFRCGGVTQHVPIDKDDDGSLHLRGSAWHFNRLSSLVYTYSDPKADQRDLPCTLLASGRRELDPQVPTVPDRGSDRGRRTYAVKEIDGQIRIFDVSTGREVPKIESALLSNISSMLELRDSQQPERAPITDRALPAPRPSSSRRIVKRYEEISEDDESRDDRSRSERGARSGPPWLQPSLGSREATRVLFDRPDGTFVIRGGPSPDCLLLTYINRGGIHDVYILRTSRPRGYCLEMVPDQPFRSLEDLVDHYSRTTHRELGVALRPDGLARASGGGGVVTSRHVHRSHRSSGHQGGHSSSHAHREMASGEGGRDWMYAASQSGRVGARRESDAGGEHLTIESQHYVSQLIARNPDAPLEITGSAAPLALPAPEPVAQPYVEQPFVEQAESRQASYVAPARVVYTQAPAPASVSSRAAPLAPAPAPAPVFVPAQTYVTVPAPAPAPVIMTAAPAPSYQVASRYPPAPTTTVYVTQPPAAGQPVAVADRGGVYTTAPGYQGDPHMHHAVQYTDAYPAPEQYIDEQYQGPYPPPQVHSHAPPPNVYVEEVPVQPLHEPLRRQGSAASFRTIDYFSSAPSSFRTSATMRTDHTYVAAPAPTPAAAASQPVAGASVPAIMPTSAPAPLAAIDPTYSTVRRGAVPADAGPEHRAGEEGMLSPGGSYPSLYTIPQTNSMRSAASRTEVPAAPPARPVPAYEAPPQARDEQGPPLPPRQVEYVASGAGGADSLSQPWPTAAPPPVPAGVAPYSSNSALQLPPPPVPPPGRVQRTESQHSVPSIGNIGPATGKSWMRLKEKLTMDQVKAELANANDGEFIVHDSETAFAALTMKYLGTCSTRPIHKNKTARKFSLGNSQIWFDNLGELVEYYRDESQTYLPIPLAGLRSTDV